MTATVQVWVDESIKRAASSFAENPRQKMQSLIKDIRSYSAATGGDKLTQSDIEAEVAAFF
jgi:hypothetical protein